MPTTNSGKWRKHAKMYVGKIVNKHEGNFDWVIIAGALGPNYVCAYVCVGCLCVCENVSCKKLSALDEAL